MRALLVIGIIIGTANLVYPESLITPKYEATTIIEKVQESQITQAVSTPTPQPLPPSTPAPIEDERGAILRQVFSRYSRTLLPYVDTFIQVADNYGLDYRVLPAIAVVESGACRQYIVSTHNCFGWGSGTISFASFDDAITTIGKSLSTGKAYKKYQQKKTLRSLAECYNGKYADTYTPKLEKAFAMFK